VVSSVIIEGHSVMVNSVLLLNMLYQVKIGFMKLCIQSLEVFDLLIDFSYLRLQNGSVIDCIALKAFL
jgi:hypothetical protein